MLHLREFGQIVLLNKAKTESSVSKKELCCGSLKHRKYPSLQLSISEAKTLTPLSFDLLSGGMFCGTKQVNLWSESIIQSS